MVSTLTSLVRFIVEDGMLFEMRRTLSELDRAGDGLRAYFTPIAGKSHEELMAWRRVQSLAWLETDVYTFVDAKIRLNIHKLAPFLNRNESPTHSCDYCTCGLAQSVGQMCCPALLMTEIRTRVQWSGPRKLLRSNSKYQHCVSFQPRPPARSI